MLIFQATWRSLQRFWELEGIREGGGKGAKTNDPELEAEEEVGHSVLTAGDPEPSLN